jgi:hypothetical protein
MTQSLPQHLAQLGDALHRAVAADLAAAAPSSKRWRRPRRAAVVVVVLAVAIPGAAFATAALISTGQVAQSLPQGTQALIGTDPICTVVAQNVEYHCVLASPPSNSGAPAGATTAPTGAIPTSALALRARACRALYDRAAGDAQCVSLSLSSAATRAILRKALRASAHSPVHATATAPNNWTGTVEPTVDATKHVNGGCRAQNAAGTDWECYIGEAAVTQNIISQGFLGQYAPVPGVG